VPCHLPSSRSHRGRKHLGAAASGPLRIATGGGRGGGAAEAEEEEAQARSHIYSATCDNVDRAHWAKAEDEMCDVPTRKEDG
jgi:hypothetical protein